MLSFNSDSSPFLVLWYFYLAFLGVVLLTNVLVIIGKRLIEMRTKHYYKLSDKNRGTK